MEDNFKAQLEAALNAVVQAENQLLDLLKTNFSEGAVTPVVPTIQTNPEKAISILLQNLGMFTHLLGFKYIKTAVMLINEDEKLLENITKGLYFEIAKIHNATPSRAERAMRHAIELMSERYSSEYQKQFGDREEKPTNAEFLAWCVEYLKLQA